MVALRERGAARSTPRARPHRRRVRGDRASASGREPNGLELAVFSLMWSEHCAYKHSKKLLRQLPTEGPHLLMGPGENAGAVDVGDGLAVRLQGRVPQPPERGRAVPGRGHRRRGHPARRLRGRARGRSPCSTRCASASSTRAARATCSTGRSRASATTATRSACPRWAARCCFEPAYEQNCLVNAMCVGLAAPRPPDPQRRRGRRQPARAARRAHRAATASAAPRCWPAPSCRTRTTSKRPTRADRRPVRGEEAARVLPRAARARAARARSRTWAPPGSRPRARPRWPRRARWASTSTCRGAAARGGHGAVRDHDLGVAGADALRGRARAARRGAGALRALGGARHRRSARSPTRAGCGCSTATSWWATCRSRRWWTTARCTTSSPEPPARPLYPDPPAAARRGRRAPSETLLALLGSPNVASKRFAVRAVRLDRRLAHRAPARQAADAAVLSSAPDGGSGAIAVSIDGNGRRVAVRPLHAARSRRCSSAPATSPAWAPSRSA